MAQTDNIENVFNWVELADSIKWPILIFASILVFRKPIIGLIGKVTKVGYGSKSIEVNQQATTGAKRNQEISRIDRTVGLFRHETIEMFTSAVSQESEYEQLTIESEQVERLAKYSCLLYIIRHFDFIYSNIFGSQLRILEYLNSHLRQTRDSINFFYLDARNNNPIFFDNYSYDQYLDFLLSFNLIREDDGILNITILGVDFLKYLTETNKDVNKMN